MLDLTAKVDRILGGYADGYPHIREHGVCVSCGAGPREWHYDLVPKNDAPIYRKMIR